MRELSYPASLPPHQYQKKGEERGQKKARAPASATREKKSLPLLKRLQGVVLLRLFLFFILVDRVFLL
jgi:hypothetical protein